MRYIARTPGYALFLGASEATIAVQGTQGRESILRVELAGADPAAVSEGLDELPGKSNYFHGESSQWKLGVSSYQRVRFRSIYEGIDAVFYGNQKQLEYDFNVAAGIDPATVRLRFTGASKIHVDRAGDLIVTVGTSEVHLQRPVSYQVVDGVRRGVKSRYVMRSANEAGFALGAYDKSKPVVIDPVLYAATMFGGNNVEQNLSIGVDLDGNAYIAGITRSPDFPVVPGALVTGQSSSAAYDAFVTKVNPTGTALLYSSYFYVSNFNFPPKIAVDAAGNAYVAGVNAPATAGVFTSASGTKLAKLNSTGTALVFAVALPGVYSVNGLAIDAAGNTYLTGMTFGSLPTTTGAFQTTFQGTGSTNTYGDAYVYKIGPDASKLIYCTYLGSNSGDQGNDIAIDSAGNAIVTGFTIGTTFPVLNAFQSTSKGGLQEGWVAKLNASGTALVYSTYLGGSGLDTPNAVAVDSAGNAYIATFTTSTNFPVTTGVFRTTNPAGSSGAITKIGPTGTLVYSTYIGANNTAISTDALAVDAAGNVYVVGSGAMPTTPDAFNTAATNYLAILNASATTLTYTTRTPAALASVKVDAAGNNIYAAGSATAGASTTPGAAQSTNNGLTDGFFLHLSNVAPPTFVYPIPTITSITPSGATSGASSATVTINGTGFYSTSTVQYNGTDKPTTFVSANQLRVTLNSADLAVINPYTITVTTPTTPGGGISNSLFFNVAAKANPAPTFSSIATPTVTAGGPGFSLTLNGTNFIDGTVIRWNGQERTTTFVSATQLLALIPASDIATAGTASITIVNPGPGGGTSTPLTLTIQAAPFTVTGVSPSTVAPGTASYTMMVSGTGFVPGMTVRWKGIDLLTTYVNSQLLLALVDALNVNLAGTADIVVVNPLGGILSGTINLTITPGAFPWVNDGGIVNGATFLAYATTPGPPFTVSSIFGVNLASDLFVATTVPLPTALGGVSVRINGILCPLFFVSKNQVNFLLPFELIGLGKAYLTVTVNGVSSNPQPILLSLFGPSIFTLNQQGTGQGAVLLANTATFAAPVNSVPGRDAAPVARGDYLSIFASGLGPVFNPPKTGEVASATVLSRTTYSPTANVGGISAPVVFSGLAPGFVGLYQVNVQVPANAPVGDAVNLFLTIGGVKSNTVTISVK